jgi:hypothetical protein
MSTCEVRLFVPKGCFTAYLTGMTVVDEIFCPPKYISSVQKILFFRFYVFKIKVTLVSCTKNVCKKATTSYFNGNKSKHKTIRLLFFSNCYSVLIVRIFKKNVSFKQNQTLLIVNFLCHQIGTTISLFSWAFLNLNLYAASVQTVKVNVKREQWNLSVKCWRPTMVSTQFLKRSVL